MRGIGLIGGKAVNLLLRWLSRNRGLDVPCSGAAYSGVSKVEAVFGPQIWAELVGKTVTDFGCGEGHEAVDLAKHGVARVIGIDVREKALRNATVTAQNAGVGARCHFVTETNERADAILSLDGFEHFDDPPRVLETMRRLLKDGGRAFIAFGPPWYHPYGGHLFSVFPWAHVLFSEKALLRWRADFKSDGATRFREVEGGLNQMTIRRFQKIVRDSDFETTSLELVPIKKLKFFHNRLSQELFTSIVRCRLVTKRKDWT